MIKNSSRINSPAARNSPIVRGAEASLRPADYIEIHADRFFEVAIG
jgi:hypothetical protein